jgi:hypothetical protein
MAGFMQPPKRQEEPDQAIGLAQAHDLLPLVRQFTIYPGNHVANILDLERM